MKDFKDMTPIELNVLVNKAKENHDIVKKNIYGLLDEIKNMEDQINSKLKNLETLESNYVELMSALMEKQS